MLCSKLQNYAQALGKLFPKNCGNLLVASQYAVPLKLVMHYMKKKSSILAWGCGGGHFSYLLLQEDFDVQSFAYGNTYIHPQVLIKAKENLGLRDWNISKGQDPITLPFLDQCFEGVISLGVLEHVRESGGDEASSLDEIYRILKPGGYFFCFHFPNRYSWIEASARCISHLGLNKYCHLHRYNKKEIMMLLEDKGFQIVEIGLYNLLPRSLLRYIPDWIAYRKEIMTIYNIFEKSASLFFKKFSQNYYFILKK